MGLIRSTYTPPRPEGLPACAYFNHRIEPNGAWVRCRRRSCPECGKAWVAMQESKMTLNLGALGGRVVLLSLTAPGADLLPWACNRKHKHAGGYGCLVDRQYATVWAEQAPDNWKSLRDAARLAVTRAMRREDPSYEPAHLVIERVWEPQKRGVPHLHVVSGARTLQELRAVKLFHRELRARATDYGFGPQLHITKPMTGREAARYLACYLLGRNGRKSKSGKAKPTIRQNLDDPLMPRLLVWETPAIGSLSRSDRMVAWRGRLGLAQGTGVTIRRLRLTRWYLAARARRVLVYPRLAGEELIAVARVAVLLERENGPPAELRLRGHVHTLQLMRLLRDEYDGRLAA